ncbi:hypothetical protein [Conexibacter woesei]|uniref:hypothetical protein n=1 Tax=Conexibacter woesei TaxID=191495 RepID=UPI0003FAD2F6|nr:hypothetical protein [Conexibacter woesei]
MPAQTADAVVIPPLPRCVWCGETIGVFEPLVYEAGEPRRVVRSAVLRLPEELRRDGGGGHAAFFHAACHEAAECR